MAAAPRQTCSFTGGGFPLDAVLDSADGAVLLSFSSDSTDATTRFRRIDATLPGPAAAAVEGAIEPFLRATEPEARYGRLIVEVTGGVVSRMALGAGPLPSRHHRP